MRARRRCRQLAALAVATLAAAACAGGASSPSSTTTTRHFTPEDRKTGRYWYVPFEVPAGVERLRIRYAYDRAGDQNVVDLGLFEPGTLGLGTPAFRGYSGGARQEVFISPTAAAPGYRAGPLPAGTWHVLLGLYKVAPAGVDVTLTIGQDREPRTSTAASGTPAPDASGSTDGSTPASTSARWYSGALHTHTLHSDGTVSPGDLLRRVREVGLDFVVITDHNNTTHREEVLASIGGAEAPPLHVLAGDASRSGGASAPPPQGPMPLWIVGEEVTTPGGHASVWGLGPGEWVDFRVGPEDHRLEDLVHTSHRHGALFAINHPTADCDGCRWDHAVPVGVDGIEVWNGAEGPQAGALARWDGLLASGRRITGVGSSDWHREPSPIDAANVRVYANALTERAILDAIRAGRVIVMRAATDLTPTITVKAGTVAAGIGGTLALGANEEATIEVQAPGLAGGRLELDSNGKLFVTVPIEADGTARVKRRLAPGYVRFELQAADRTTVAVTNPVYVSLRQ